MPSPALDALAPAAVPLAPPPAPATSRRPRGDGGPAFRGRVAAAIVLGSAACVIAGVTAPLAGGALAGARAAGDRPSAVGFDTDPSHLAGTLGSSPAAPRTALPPAAPAPALGAAGLTTRPHGPTGHTAVDASVRTPAVDRTSISQLAANGIPAVALNAYRVAAARMADVDPACGIDWSLLAGIGRVESDHGQFAGAVLHADGVSTPPIIGPALDGKHWDYVPAPPDGLALDGDAKYAHALGPMQFIPSTWNSWGVDADGDGTADIFDINDAALAAGRYLCAAGGDLRTHAGQVAAVLTYNHNTTYLAEVLALAHAYRVGIPVTGIPTGITAGPLPKSPTGLIPPANPGPPAAPRHRQHSPGGRAPQQPRAPHSPSQSPTQPTHAPTAPTTRTPTRAPSRPPSRTPTRQPTHQPTHRPTGTPTPVCTPTGTPTSPSPILTVPSAPTLTLPGGPTSTAPSSNDPSSSASPSPTCHRRHGTTCGCSPTG